MRNFEIALVRVLFVIFLRFRTQGFRKFQTTFSAHSSRYRFSAVKNSKHLYVEFPLRTTGAVILHTTKHVPILEAEEEGKWT